MSILGTRQLCKNLRRIYASLASSVDVKIVLTITAIATFQMLLLFSPCLVSVQKPLNWLIDKCLCLNDFSKFDGKGLDEGTSGSKRE